jgi:addiction module HigA family antidote
MEIVHGERSISPDTAARLGRYFNMSPEFWLGLQADYDLATFMDSKREAIERDVQPREET